MIWGDSWVCNKCGWANLYVRGRCRECGEDKPAEAKVMPALEAAVIALAESPESNQQRKGAP
jgi:predicted ATP-dependent serine protease